MKKVLSFVLVLSMILGSFGMAFATDYAGSDYEDAITMLTTLGVVEGYTDGTFKPEKVVTRAEAATMIIKAMDLQDYAVGKAAFTDMEGHWANPFVAYAVSLGFVKGNTDGTFAPDAAVTSDQMITMLVQALGYEAQYLVGGYPGAFVNQAKTLGMLEGVKSGSQGATRGEVAQLIYNTLDCEFVRYDKDGNLNAVSRGDDNDTMMKRLVEGATVVTKVVSGAETGLNMKEYQGAYAELVVNEDGDVVAIDEIKSVFLTGKMNSKGKFVADEVEYTTPATVQYKLTSGALTGAAMFINGKTTDGNITLNTTNTVTIAAKVSGKTIKEIYSVADWNATATFQWTEDDAEMLAENDKLSETYQATFKPDDNGEIDTDEFVLVGAASLADIKEDAIVTFYEANGNVVKVEVSTKTVKGTVEGFKVVDFVSKAAIGGTYYDVVGNVDGDAVTALGDEGTFFFNYAGEIVAKEAVSDPTYYALVTKVAGSDASGIYDSESTFKIKLLTAEGKEVIYTITDEVYTAVSGTAVTGSVISYEFNKDGEIDAIDVKASTGSITTSALTAKGYLDGFKVAKDVLVFTSEYAVSAPANTKYKVASMAIVPVGEDLHETFYVVDSTTQEVVVIFSSDSATEDGVYGVVLEAWEAKDGDDTVSKVKLLIDGKEVPYTCTRSGFTATTSLYAFDFVGGELNAAQATPAGLTGTCAAIKDGNVKLGGVHEADGYQNVADDVVVYFINADGEFEVKALKDIAKKDVVELYQVDTDDKDGFDIIIYTKPE